MTATLGREQLEAVAALFGVLAEPTRLAILQALRGGGRSVGSLVDELDARQANISKQLGILYAAGLLARERHGNEVHYSIREPMIFELCELVCGKLRRDAERQVNAFRPRPGRGGRTVV
jgi:DNA-binding transcriptional ArsR family regulator